MYVPYKQECTVSCSGAIRCHGSTHRVASSPRCIKGVVVVQSLTDPTILGVGFLAEGLQKVPAGVGSVIIDSQPLTVAVVAALVFGESITPLGVFGLFLGLAGLLLLELPEEQLAAFSTLDFGAFSITSTTADAAASSITIEYA